jgi:hypothetical protein
MCLSSRDLRVIRTLLCLVLAGEASTLSDAQTTVGIDASAKFASNPLLEPGRDNAAMVFEISVLPEFKDVDSRGNSIDLAGVATLREYSRRYSRAVLGSFTATREFRQSERFSGKASLGVTRDLVGDTPTIGVDALVAPQSLRTTLNASGDILWHPDALTTITPAISALRSTYDRTTELRETRSAEASVDYARKISGTTTLGVRPLVAISHTLGQPTLHRYAFYGTVQQRLSPVLQLDFDLGAEHLPSSDAIAPAVAARPSATLLAGSMRLCAKARRLDACLSAELGSQVSALDGFQRTKSVRATVAYHLSERKLVTVQLDYQRIAAAVSLGQRGELESGDASVTLDWRMTSSLTLSGVAGYALRQSDLQTKPHSTYVGLRLRLTPRQR